MRWDDIYVSAVAASLPRQESTADAVADGRYDAEENEASGYLAVRVCDSGPAVDLAVDAGNKALRRSGIDPDEFALLAHASIGHQGLDEFAAASHVQSRTIRGRAMAVEVRQASNGGMAGLELAAAFLSVRAAPCSALIMTADRFSLPAVNRFRSAAGVLLGDAGTALVLSHGQRHRRYAARPVARLLSTHSIGDSTYEGLQVGGEPWADYPGANGWPVSAQARVEGFIAQHGPEIFPDLVGSIMANEGECIERVLAESGTDAADVAWWVFPNMGLALTDWDARKAIGADVSRTTWEWGRQQGHLGAGDQLAGLNHLLESRTARPGDRVLLQGAGTGFSFSAAIVEVLDVPEWAGS